MTTLDDLEVAGGITLKKPWPACIAYGPKRVENRSRKPDDKILDERVAVHCGKSWDDFAKEVMDSGPRDLFGGRTRLAEAMRAWRDGLDVDPEEILAPGHIMATAHVVGWVEDAESAEDVEVHVATGDTDTWEEEHAGLLEWSLSVHRDVWFTGPVGWLLDDVRTLDSPIPARGQQGVWDVETQVEKAREG